MYSILISVLIIFGAPKKCHAFRYVKINEKPRPFELTMLNGDERFLLYENLGDKATVLLFWATWNPRSHDALLDYQRLFSDHQKDGLQVIGVNVEHEELTDSDLKLIWSFVQKSSARFPILLDEGLHVFSEYGVSALPSTILLDSAGVAVELLPGYAPNLRDDFRERVLKSLGLYVEPVKIKVHEEGYRPKGKAARYFMMAKLLLRKGMKEKAVRALTKALEEDPGYYEAERLLFSLNSENDN